MNWRECPFCRRLAMGTVREEIFDENNMFVVDNYYLCLFCNYQESIEEGVECE